MSIITNNPNTANPGSAGHTNHSSSDPSSAMNQLLLHQHDAPKAPFGSQGDHIARYVQFKGRPGALELIIDADAPLLAILDDLQRSLVANRAMLEHISSLKLNFGPREVDKLQFGEIQRVIHAHRLKITGLALQPEALSSFLEGEFGVPVQIQLPASSAAIRPEKMAQTPPHTETHPTPVDVLRQGVSAGHPASVGHHVSGPPSSRDTASTPQRRTIAGANGPVPAQVMYTPDAMPSLDPLPSLPSANSVSKQPQTTHVSHGSGQPQTTHISHGSGQPHSSYVSHVSHSSHAPHASHGSGPVHSVQAKAAHNAAPISPKPSAPSAANHASVSPGTPAVSGDSGQSSQRALHKVMRTCRAGTFLHFDGDVMIFGDVNAGAEVKASGDIIVLGSLLGVAHAGCLGDTSARIFASDMSPTQLRVAHQIAIAPPTESSRQRNRMFFDMAFLNGEEQIEVKSVEAGRVPN